MNKDGYILVFKQIQSIHLGIRGYGVLSETRIFITGQAMWGALTNSYGRSKKWSNGDFENNENKEIFEKITCFYPSFTKNYNGVMLPGFKRGEFYLEGYSEKDFRNEFVDGFISTAIQPMSLTAKDKSLHEMEIILPKDKGNEKQLYWVGLLWIEEDVKTNFLKEKELEIIIGGDSRYGLGRLKLERVEEISDEFLDKWGIEKANNLNSISLSKNKDNHRSKICNFLKRDGYNFEGKLELLADFNFHDKVLPDTTNPQLCIVPGSKVEISQNNFDLKRGIYQQ